MRKCTLVSLSLAVCLAIMVLTPGCHNPKTAGPGDPPPLEVTAFQPIVKPDVVDYMYFAGTAKAVEAVDVKPRVSGYLDRLAVEKGGQVKGPYWQYKFDTPEYVACTVGRLLADRFSSSPLIAAGIAPQRVEGEVLFEIDPRPYQAAFDQAYSQVNLAEAKYKSAVAIYAMNKQAVIEGKKKLGDKVTIISASELETYSAAELEAKASWESAKASLESFRLDLLFTKVRAPVSGKISQNYLSRGNLVTKDVTTLARITSQNPMWVYFDIDEKTVQDLVILRNKKQIDRSINFNVDVGLSEDKGRYPYQGKLDYIAPEVDPSMGTRTYRAIFEHLPADQLDPALMSGNFVRVRVSKGKPPYPAPVVPEKALIAEKNQRYLLVVDAQGKVTKEELKLGAQLDNGYRVILPPDDMTNTSGQKATLKDWTDRWAQQWVILDGVGEAQDKVGQPKFKVNIKARVKLDYTKPLASKS